jgi:hypothetical protein
MAALTYDLDLIITMKRAGTTVATRTIDLDGQAIDELHYSYDDVPNAAADQALGLGAVTTAAVFIVISDENLTIKLNGGSETFNIFAGVPFVAQAVTAATVSNASGSDAEVEHYSLGT